MSNSRGKPTVADTARREAKLLGKPTKLTLDPFGKTDVELKQPFPKELGEYAVIVIATPMTVVQFTIAHPIGITDLDSGAWVAHRSDQLQGMLARAKDPNQATLDQSRTHVRQRMAVQEGLLKQEELDGKMRFFYPHRLDMDRNQLLEDARARSKEAASQIKAQIASLTDDRKHEKQGLLTQLHHAEDPLSYLDTATSEAESKLREFYKKPQVLEKVLEECPQKYRTMSGPYYTVPQVEIPNSKNLRLEDVAIRIARDLARGSAVTPKPFTPLGVTGPGAGGSPSQPLSDPPGGAKPKPGGPPSPGADTATEEGEEVIDPGTGKKTILSRLTGSASKKKT